MQTDSDIYHGFQSPDTECQNTLDIRLKEALIWLFKYQTAVTR